MKVFPGVFADPQALERFSMGFVLRCKPSVTASRLHRAYFFDRFAAKQ
jgi:hypothetical protein